MILLRQLTGRGFLEHRGRFFALITFVLLSIVLAGMFIFSLVEWPELGRYFLGGGILILSVGIFLLAVWLRQLTVANADLQKKISETERMAGATKKRLAGVFRLSNAIVEASNEDEVVELMLSLSVELVGAMGASLVPYDERGQPMAAINYGDLPAPVFDAWIEYLATPEIRNQCDTCQEQGRLKATCPLLQTPLFDTIKAPRPSGVYCLPLKRGDHEFGVMNLYLPEGMILDDGAQAFLKAMVDETALAIESVRLRRRELSALRQLHAVRRRTDLNALLKAFLDNLRDTLEADFAILKVPENELNQPPIDLFVGQFPDHERSFIEGIQQGVIASGETILLGDVTGESANGRNLRSLAAAPLISPDGRSFGTILAASEKAQGFKPRQLALLGTVAGQVALVIRNAYLMAEMEFKTTMEERSRLAREIHDGLAQTLGFLKLQTAQMRNYLSQGDLDQLSKSLQTSYEILSDAYLDARQAIDGLRINPENGLAAWLEQTALEFQETSGLIVELIDVRGGQILAPEVQVQLIRIVQEGLSNIRKHAQASKVWVSCSLNRDDVILEIRDNGIGFSPKDVPGASRYGLRGMRERSELIGAEFQVISRVNEGTTIRLRLPLAVEEAGV